MMYPLYDPVFKRKVTHDHNWEIVLFVWMGVRIRETNKRVRDRNAAAQREAHHEARLRNELEIGLRCMATAIPVLQREVEEEE